jgi:hypothetical protein
VVKTKRRGRSRGVGGVVFVVSRGVEEEVSSTGKTKRRQRKRRKGEKEVKDVHHI